MEFASLVGIALWALIPGFIAKKKGRNFWGYYFLSFLISPLITMIITACLSKKTEIDNIKEVNGPINNPINEPITGKDEIRFCRKCGEKLIDNSQFCRKCGTEIVEMDDAVDTMDTNCEFCRKCSADISNDTDTCHVCGEKKGTESP